MIPAQFLRALNVPIQRNIHVHESPQEQATRANHAACMYVKSIGELFMGLERGIKVEECAFHNSCTKV